MQITIGKSISVFFRIVSTTHRGNEMFKKYLVLIIILSIFQLPMSIDTNSGFILNERGLEISVESGINSEIFPSLQPFTPSAITKGNVILQFNHGVDIFAIRNMSYYRSIAKAFNASDIVFVHTYLLHHTGTGKAMFPAGCFAEVKKMYPN